MIHRLQRPCGTASVAIRTRCKSACSTSALTPQVPAQRIRAHNRHTYTGRLFTSSRRDAQTLVRAGRDTLLRGVPSEYKDDVVRVVEQAERAADTSWTTIHTDFYTPPVVSHAMLAIQQLASVKAVPFGGYSQAERQRIIMGQPELVEALELDPSQENCVAALGVKGNFMFESATHRDFLGSILGTGIERSKVGDIIILGETGAQILVAAELVEHFEQSLTQVRRVPVTTRQIDLSELTVRQPKTEQMRILDATVRRVPVTTRQIDLSELTVRQPKTEQLRTVRRVPVVTRQIDLSELTMRQPKTEQMRTVEASLRLDAVTSAGFRISRGKAADLIKHGDVRVNWREAKGSSVVKEGDVISCSGKGRIEVTSTSLTQKGRHAVELTRYV